MECSFSSTQPKFAASGHILLPGIGELLWFSRYSPARTGMGQVGRNYWDISSWYGIQQQYYHNNTLIRANVGDSIYGYVQQQTGQPTHWLIWTYEINTDKASSIYAYTDHTFDWNYVALETYNVNNCNRLSGGNDFTNLHLAGRTPSWTAEINQTLKAQCGTLGVNIVSPSEVILQTGRMP